MSQIEVEVDRGEVLALARAFGPWQAAKKCGLKYITVQRWLAADDARLAGAPPPRPRGRPRKAVDPLAPEQSESPTPAPPKPAPKPPAPPKPRDLPAKVVERAELATAKVMVGATPPEVVVRRITSDPLDTVRNPPGGRGLLDQAATALLTRITRDAPNMPIGEARQCFTAIFDVILAAKALEIHQRDLLEFEHERASQSPELEATPRPSSGGQGEPAVIDAVGEGADDDHAEASADDLALDPPAE